ncbi:MAG: zinc-dependent alcohol dehydrogenase family protein [Lentisphaeraceae bacterium]|nr:zinc-dependent alcohol dehydrogenase family protein [Lentisphaeraceae bacterium]
MRCMLLNAAGKPLVEARQPRPQITNSQVLLKVECCGVCRTDLHIVDGELSEASLPLIPGHQIIGRVCEIGNDVTNLELAMRVGVPWLAHTCGHCFYCRQQKENLCDEAYFTGYSVNGGFAEYCAAEADFCFAIPDKFSSLQAAPLMCAGLIGYRALRKAGSAQNIGMYGFGAAAHIICQVADFLEMNVFAFTREGDAEAQNLALALGAQWAGASTEKPPVQLDAAIIFAPVGWLVPQALKMVRKGGRVICAGIHMSDIPAFSYDLLWGERELVSVANLTREDGHELLSLAAQIPIKKEVYSYSLEKANEALDDLRAGRINGAAVIVI